MRISLALILVAALGCSGGDGGSGGAALKFPRVYPLVRANTPAGLIADPNYQAAVAVTASALSHPGAVGRLPQALGGAVNLAIAVQERLYTPGPTEILRIVTELDGRLASLETDVSTHPCLSAAPTSHSYALPGGATFEVKLQCLQSLGGPAGGGGWIGFGFDNALSADAGADAAAAQNDFYLVQGQANGMGGAYHVDRRRGNVEAWLAVADSNVPMNSQVIIHLSSERAAGTLELAFAGSGVGFCSAHLKTAADMLFIRGKTNGAAAPGTNIAPGTQYCDAVRAGCFAVAALDTDLGGDAVGCSAIAANSFDIQPELDASTDAEANVMYPKIYTYFDQSPSGVAAF